MITNETRARLVSRPRYWGARFDGPFYDTDANAVAELRAFVRARGKVDDFVDALYDLLARTSREIITAAFTFDMLDATPAQQCAAFDIVFKDELERINET